MPRENEDPRVRQLGADLDAARIEGEMPVRFDPPRGVRVAGKGRIECADHQVASAVLENIFQSAGVRLRLVVHLARPPGDVAPFRGVDAGLG